MGEGGGGTHPGEGGVEVRNFPQWVEHWWKCVLATRILIVREQLGASVVPFHGGVVCGPRARHRACGRLSITHVSQNRLHQVCCFLANKHVLPHYYTGRLASSITRVSPCRHTGREVVSLSCRSHQAATPGVMLSSLYARVSPLRTSCHTITLGVWRSPHHTRLTTPLHRT